MEIKDILDERIIDLNMVAKDKDEVIQHLASLLTDAGYVKDKEEYIKDVYLRESEGITGMGNHVAIPHGKSAGVEKVGIAIGRTTNMIEWESYDEQPINLIFLFAVPDGSEGAKTHLKILANLAGKLGNDSIIKGLESVQSVSDLQRVFA